MTVITISREYFGGGEPVGKRVTDELGYRLVTKQTVEKILRQYGLVQLDELQKSPGFWARVDASNLELISRLNTIILGFAQLDNMVIIGRGGFAVLREYANVLNVRIQAPFTVRVQRVMASQNLSETEAEKLVTQNDKARATFVKGFYDVDFYDTRPFQLVLDTHLVPVERASDWIVEVARNLANREFGEALTTQKIEVESILANAIQEALIH
ncbi:MAG: cytidylate kinase-like family protein [Anaerolineales bacterium]|nr:cytidylate kinase-like family protein [Anaerolineales bacterium]